MSIFHPLKNWTVLFSALLLSVSLGAKGLLPQTEISRASLPPEARHTLRLIEQGGPFPFTKDGSVFNNYERLLPKKNRGYYREYTVKTPGARDRGARRIVAGGPQARFESYYYTSDHYASFKRIREPE